MSEIVFQPNTDYLPAIQKLPASAERTALEAAVPDVLKLLIPNPKKVQLENIDVLIKFLSTSPNHNPSLHEGANPNDVDMAFCPQCNAIVLLGRIRAAL